VVAAEARAVARDLSDGARASEASADLRAAARYALLAAGAIARQAERDAVAVKPPRLSAGMRVALLVRARLSPV
jgi:hypothetical protein